MNVLDFTAEKAKRIGPDNAYAQTIDGIDWFMFSASYTDGESYFNIMFWAESWEDAAFRVATMRENLTLDGQIYKQIPAE